MFEFDPLDSHLKESDAITQALTDISIAQEKTRTLSEEQRLLAHVSDNIAELELNFSACATRAPSPTRTVTDVIEKSGAASAPAISAPNLPINGPQKASLNDFEIKRVIGMGTYGKVFLVRKKNGADKNCLYAMKVLKKASILTDAKQLEYTKAERLILEAAQHPFIVNLAYAFQTEGKLCLVMEYICGGELFTYLDKQKMILEGSAKFYLAELTLAIAHLHDLGIIYRDLKPENVMLDQDGHILLTDFGLCKVGLRPNNGENSGGHERTRTFCGTAEYMAPEIISRDDYNTSVDWWSLGVLAFEMLVGKKPFNGNSQKVVMDKILKEKPRYPTFLSPEAVSLLKGFLEKDPKKRLGARSSEQVLCHPFFRKIKWEKLILREILPPYRPKLIDPMDTSHFLDDFTNMPLTESLHIVTEEKIEPSDAVSVENTAKSKPRTINQQKSSTSSSDPFAGFSYVSSAPFDHFDVKPAIPINTTTGEAVAAVGRTAENSKNKVDVAHQHHHHNHGECPPTHQCPIIPSQTNENISTLPLTEAETSIMAVGDIEQNPPVRFVRVRRAHRHAPKDPSSLNSVRTKQ